MGFSSDKYLCIMHVSEHVEARVDSVSSGQVQSYKSIESLKKLLLHNESRLVFFAHILAGMFEGACLLSLCKCQSM